MNKPKKFITGMLAMALVFGMAVIGCDHGGGGGSGGGGGGGTSTALAGTIWEDNYGGGEVSEFTLYRLRFTNSTATLTMPTHPSGGTIFSNAPYTYSGGRVKITVKVGGQTAVYWATVAEKTMSLDMGVGAISLTKQ